MDEKLKNALEYSKFMISLNNQKSVMLEKYRESLIYYYNGGKFLISPELLSFCKLLIDHGHKSTVMADSDGIPIEIFDLDAFLKTLISEYTQASNSYLVEYQKLIKLRSTKGIFDL